jgi:hypothetical protein
MRNARSLVARASDAFQALLRNSVRGKTDLRTPINARRSRHRRGIKTRNAMLDASALTVMDENRKYK